jgi:ATP-binding cassette subfamily B protein
LPQPFRGSVEFRNVSFRYPDAEEDMLHGINFTARAGQTVGIIGTTGSGKSTVVNLIPRFYDVTGGEVLVDGMDVRKVRATDLRDQIGYIPQQSNLFSGDIASNLLFADENADEPAMRTALELAQASEFVFSDEQGLQADVSQGGVNFSGGQKQRLAIARALVKKPAIYIFDDCLSALDFKTDLALRKALKKETGNSTMIIVTQRVATIKNAEQIVVMNEGEIVGKGTHKELMKTCETYREIALSQLSEKELSR